MAVQGDVLLVIIPQAVRIDDVDGVLLALDGALLQGGQGVLPGHGHGVDLEGLEGLGIDLVLHHAELQVFHVRGGGNGLDGVGDVAEAALSVGQALEVGALQLVQQLLADFAVQDLVGFLVVGKEEGHIQHAHFLAEVDEGAGGDDAQVQHVHAHGVQHIAFAAQHAVGIDFNFVFAVRAFADQFGEFFRRDLEGILLVDGGAELENGFSAGRKGQDQAQSEGETERKIFLHDGFLLIFNNISGAPFGAGDSGIGRDGHSRIAPLSAEVTSLA